MSQSGKETFTHKFKRTLKARLVSGILIMIPLVITILIIQLLYDWTAGKITPFIAQFFGESLKEPYISMISVALIVIIIYFAGMLATVMLGRKLISGFEAVILKIPLIKNIYGASKQVVDAISVSDRAAFKSVVLVQFPHPGMLAVGFLTGTILDSEGEQFYKIFIPTTPNPTTGFFEIVKPANVILTEMLIEDAFKIVMSGGIISAEKLPFKLGDKLK